MEDSRCEQAFPPRGQVYRAHRDQIGQSMSPTRRCPGRVKGRQPTVPPIRCSYRRLVTRVFARPGRVFIRRLSGGAESHPGTRPPLVATHPAPVAQPEDVSHSSVPETASRLVHGRRSIGSGPWASTRRPPDVPPEAGTPAESDRIGKRASCDTSWPERGALPAVRRGQSTRSSAHRRTSRASVLPTAEATLFGPPLLAAA